MKKRIAILMLTLAMVFTGCGSTGEASGAAFTIEKDGETVGEVSEAYAWLNTLSYKDTFESFFGDTFWSQTDESGVTYGESFKEELLNELKMRKVVVLEAEEQGITLSEEEMDICRTNAEDTISYITEETMELTGIDEEVLAEFEADYAIYEKYQTQVLAEQKVEIDIDDVRQSDLFVLSFPTQEETEAGEIIEYEDDVKAEVKAQADAAYAMLESGKTMEQVAEANDMDPEECMEIRGKTAEEYQDEYYDAAFEEAAFSLKEGEYSEVVEGIDGYYIIQMVTYENEEETALAMEDAEAEAGDSIFSAMVEEMLEKYDITVNDKVWEKIDFTANIAFVEEDYEEYYEEESDTDEETDEEETESVG